MSTHGTDNINYLSPIKVKLLPHLRILMTIKNLQYVHTMYIHTMETNAK